jgi:hypothetical protein
MPVCNVSKDLFVPLKEKLKENKKESYLDEIKNLKQE